MKSRILPHAALSLCLLVLAACSDPAPDPRAELDRIVADGQTAGTVESFRTEPTATPSHRAVIRATDGDRTCRFQVFFKDGSWFYETPLELVVDGEVHDNYDISTSVSIIAYKFDFDR
jgi:hypothetical protein